MATKQEIKAAITKTKKNENVLGEELNKEIKNTAPNSQSRKRDEIIKSRAYSKKLAGLVK
jgi:hypothetical protein